MTLLRRRWQEFLEFLFPPETDKWLAVLRVGLGLQVVVYTLFLRSDWHQLFSTTGKGLVSREVGEAITSFDSPLIPKLGWLVAFGQHLGFSEETVLSVTWACLLCMGCCLLLGLFCRPAAIIAWFLHLCTAESGGLLAYGADNFMTMALFYLMLSPLPDRYSVDSRLVKTTVKDPRLLGFWRRVLQVHLCFVYFFGGLAKLLGSGWWNGSNLWRSLIRPPFNLLSPDILVRFKYALPVLGISICLIEIGYPVFIWLKKTRFLWLVCILAMHAAIGLMMGMYLFALVMIVLNLAAFGIGIRVPFIKHPAGGTRHSAQATDIDDATRAQLRAQTNDVPPQVGLCMRCLRGSVVMLRCMTTGGLIATFYLVRALLSHVLSRQSAIRTRRVVDNT